MRLPRLIAALLLLAGCAKQVPPAHPPPALEQQKELAAQQGPDQTLELVRLASLALAEGQRDLAENALRRAAVSMQDFRAEGQFRAIVGAERAKEWKGEPYEKMMAFLYLGILLYEEGDYGNALAMSKSAVLADTGTTIDRYRSDFVPAFVLQALCYDALGERHNAERAMRQAVDALWMRAMIDHLSGLLEGVRLERDVPPGAEKAARVLLLAGLPAGLTAHPRDPHQAVAGALSYASDLRRVALDGKRRDWPESLTGVRKADLKGAHNVLEPLTRRWQQALTALPRDIVGQLEHDEAFLLGLLDDPGLLLWVEAGQGPMKVATGDYGQLLRIVPRMEGRMPRVTINGHPLRPQYLDSVTYQALTRGGRQVDGFLKGKAVFKDSSFILGWTLLTAGDLANAVDDDRLAAVLYIAGAATWVAGAVVNPRADTRQWEHLPDTLWLVRADLPPGDHALQVNGRRYTVQIPESGRVTALLPRLAPGGPAIFGAPCRTCEAPDAPRAGRPLAIPVDGVP